MTTARLTTDSRFQVGAINRRLFGSFVEHLGRCVYGGIYDPGHPSADEQGFRQDVMDLVRELGVTTVRYPGGNFVSGFRWEDSVGPKAERPRRPELAWHSVETNQVGLDEFADWAAKTGTELMYAINLGTRGVLEAVDVLEYANLPGGTALSEARIRHGHPAPHNIRMWCLGNEMDGPWQVGYRTAEAYGTLASQVAKAMRRLDPDLELVVCGSSHSRMPTFGEWDRTVLSHTYDDVDFISCHAYYDEGDDLTSFLASGVDMDRFIEAVVAVADTVGATRKSQKKIAISFDEWNVWSVSHFHAEEEITDINQWPFAPRLLEASYTVADAVVVGGLLISLLKHADRVQAASLAQLVNVIAPIRAEPNAPAWRQTTFYPFALTAKLAQGTVLRSVLDSPVHATERFGEVSDVDAVVTHDDATACSAVFVVNRGSQLIELTVPLAGLGATRVVSAETIADPDRHAQNTLADPDRVTPRPNASARVADGMLVVSLPPASWTAISLA